MYRSENVAKECFIALVGKYTKQPDTYASMTKALDHASLACGRKLSLKVILYFKRKRCMSIKQFILF